MGGLSGENYRQNYQIQPRAAFWFNEDFGLEVFYTARFNSPNNAYKALVQASGGGQVPYIREIKSQIGILFNWAPWYAKINVFNSILYFDWYFSLGLGTMNTEIGPREKTGVDAASWSTESLFAVYLGTGHLFHISEKFMVRFEALAHFYSAEIFKGIAGAPQDKAIFSNLTYNLGIGLRL
jgi:outer membrane beta-barrel protein